MSRFGNAGSPGLKAVFLAVALLLLTATVALWIWQRHEADQARRSEAEDRAVVNAATRETMAWASVDYKEVDAYVESVTEGATGAFLQQFGESEKALRQLITSNRSVQVPTIPKDGAGLVERSGNEAKVLISMDASVTNKATKTPAPRQYRLLITLTKQDGEWLTSGLEFIDARS